MCLTCLEAWPPQCLCKRHRPGGSWQPLPQTERGLLCLEAPSPSLTHCTPSALFLGLACWGAAHDPSCEQLRGAFQGAWAPGETEWLQ